MTDSHNARGAQETLPLGLGDVPGLETLAAWHAAQGASAAAWHALRRAGLRARGAALAPRARRIAALSRSGQR